MQIAVIEFLATWRLLTWARVSDLESDLQVAAETDQLLLETLTLADRLARPMQRDIELEGNCITASMYITVYARPQAINAYSRWARRQPHA